KQLALIQSRFLNRFALELYELNSQVVELLQELLQKFLQQQKQTTDLAQSRTLERIFTKAIGSGQELRDYLASIKHYAHLAENDTYQVNKAAISLAPLLGKVINQFEALVFAKQLLIQLECPPQLQAWSDPMLLEAMIFNLVAN